MILQGWCHIHQLSSLALRTLIITRLLFKASITVFNSVYQFTRHDHLVSKQNKPEGKPIYALIQVLSNPWWVISIFYFFSSSLYVALSVSSEWMKINEDPTEITFFSLFLKFVWENIHTTNELMKLFKVRFKRFRLLKYTLKLSYKKNN